MASPKPYSGPVGPFLAPDQDMMIVALALRKTRGHYQRLLVTGWERWDGGTLRGKARTDGRCAKGYYDSRKQLKEKLRSCGIFSETIEIFQPKIPPVYPRKRPEKKEKLLDPPAPFPFNIVMPPAPSKLLSVQVKFYFSNESEEI